MDNKKLIAGFGYQEGRISSWDGKRTYTQAVPQMAKHCCDNGVDEILVYDWSVTDEDHVSVMLNLQVEEEELINRLLERGKVSGRSDDNLETIKSRLDVYHKQTAPLADYYIGEGKHVAIKGMGTIEEIFGRIKDAVNNL